MLGYKTGAYANAGLPADKDATGSYYPDSVVEPLLDAARVAARQSFAQETSQQPPGAVLTDATAVTDGPRFSFDKSRALIIEALENFDPALGQKAREIFEAGFDAAIQKNFIEDLSATMLTEDESRWRIRHVESGKMHIMRCLEAGSEATEWDPANPNAKAVIQFEYDDSINSTIYLAHELGHAIADDYIRAPDGQKFGDNPKHMDEFQAYVVQNIVYDHLMKSDDPAVAKAAKEQFDATMTRNLWQMPVSLAAQEAQKTKTETGTENNKTLEEWLGPQWRQYKPAQDVADAIDGARNAQGSKHLSAVAEKKLDDTAARLHSRPVGLLLARGMVTQLQGADPQTRRRVSEALLGRDGPQNMSEVLAAAGVETPADMQKFSAAAMKSATQGVTATMKAPAAAAQNRVRNGLAAG
ncbi:MAG: hypothetical protein GC185_00345 [Alphaproteobacteria bacterium]|nr:hypothetical protein [Alphaproteobacteria bacterium]